jgi:hypothetical protein
MRVNQSEFAGIHPFVFHWTLSNLGSVLTHLAIGAILVSGPFARPALGISVAWALVIWRLGEPFGLLLSGFALSEGGPPGPALLFAMFGVMCGRADTILALTDAVGSHFGRHCRSGGRFSIFPSRIRADRHSTPTCR